MGRKKRFRIKQKQRQRRRQRLKRLRGKNLKINEYFLDGRYIGPKAER